MPNNLIYLLLPFLCTVNFSVKSEKNDSIFVPSREWQPVRRGQPIPSGLHVRHNFQSGLTEAKYLDEESENVSEDEERDSRAKSLALHPDKSIGREEDYGDVANDERERRTSDAKISPKELKARLKKIKLLDNEIPQDITKERSEKEAQERFGSYTNLKNEFRAHEINITTDAEILATLFQRFENHRDSIASLETLTNSVTEDILQILNGMEDLLHRIDNAWTFADMGGMARIVSLCFNVTNDEIKSEALKLLGTAVQSNPKVQAKALEHDFVQKLLHLLATNNKVTVQSRCLFALGALVRQYPAAQKTLIDHGCLEIFGKILENGHAQAQSRIMKLMSDLVVERRDLYEIEDEALRRKKSREYTLTDFEKKLLNHDYCKRLSNLMIKSFSNEAFGDSNLEDYDFLAVTLDGMILLGSICKRDFRSEKYSLLVVIDEALRHYESVRDATSDDDYSFGHLVSLLIGLRTRLKLFDESREEL